MSKHQSTGLTRRSLLIGTVLGLAAGTPLAWLGLRGLNLSEKSLAKPKSPLPTSAPPPGGHLGMPGRYPGKVVEVHHPGAVSRDYQIQADTVKGMVGRGMTQLCDCDHPAEAWRSFFQKGDVVGIKVNPVGRKPKPGEWGRNPNSQGAISSPELLIEVIEGLKSAGLPPRDIIVFERYADEFAD